MALQAFAASKQLCDSITQEQVIVMDFLQRVRPLPAWTEARCLCISHASPDHQHTMHLAHLRASSMSALAGWCMQHQPASEHVQPSQQWQSRGSSCHEQGRMLDTHLTQACMQVNHEVLTEMQEAQVMVASYPWFPDSLAICNAVAEDCAKLQAEAGRGSRGRPGAALAAVAYHALWAGNQQ